MMDRPSKPTDGTQPKSRDHKLCDTMMQSEAYYGEVAQAEKPIGQGLQRRLKLLIDIRP